MAEAVLDRAGVEDLEAAAASRRRLIGRGSSSTGSSRSSRSSTSSRCCVVFFNAFRSNAEIARERPDLVSA